MNETKCRESKRSGSNEGLDCPYCKQPAKLVDSKEIYGISYGWAWFCKPCKAWVGCHKNSKKHAPLGRLANAELRYWKKKAHAVFDPLWQRKMKRDNCTKGQARKAAYKWLAKQLQIEIKDCHVGMFDVEKCKKTVEACRAI